MSWGSIRVSRRQFLSAAAATVGVAGATGVYAWRIEPHWVEVVERPLPIANLPDALVGKRAIQISDLHLGAIVDTDYLIATLRRISDLKPDLVFITGDFMTYNHDGQQDDVARLLEHLELGPLGCVAIFGNHDYSPNFQDMAVGNKLADRLHSVGVTLLRNQSTNVAGLNIIGIDEFWGPNFRPWDVLPLADQTKPHLALCHNPDAADQPIWSDYQGWLLCGHTHGGQVKPPFLTPPILPVINRRYVAGEYDLGDGRRMYINRGIGYAHRIRFNVRPEITVFQLTREANSQPAV